MKRISNDPTNQSTVPVLDTDGSPLMPTRPSRARRLMRQGRAKKCWRKGVFAIVMLDVSSDDPDVVVDGVELNIDPGREGNWTGSSQRSRRGAQGARAGGTQAPGQPNQEQDGQAQVTQAEPAG